MASKAKRLTPKQAKFVKGIAEGLPAGKSAQQAYDVSSYEVARSIASENLTKPNIRQAVDEALTLHELTAESAVLIVKRAMVYEGITERDSLEMNLKGTDRLLKLLQMTEDKTAPSGNINIFNNSGASTYIKKD